MTRTLVQWESHLSGMLPEIRLLSELGLNHGDMLDMASLIKDETAMFPNLHRTTVELINKYPCTFVAFLGAFAAHNTEREFWDALGRLLGVSGNDLSNADWRHHFIRILKQLGKNTFENAGGATNRYVTSMRIHGGIPAYSLGDFFANMLMPALERPEYLELEGAEARQSLPDGRTVIVWEKVTPLLYEDFTLKWEW